MWIQKNKPLASGKQIASELHFIEDYLFEMVTPAVRAVI